MGRVQRRDFLITGGALLAASLATHAQRAGRVYRIGYLSPDSPYLEPFQAGLSGLGWVEGRSFVIENASGRQRRKA